MLYAKIFTAYFLITLLASCKNSDNSEINHNSDSLTHKRQITLKDSVKNTQKVLLDSTLDNTRVKLLFDSTERYLELSYSSNKKRNNIDIGAYSNTFGDPPITALRKIDDSTLGIIVITNYVDFGYSSDELYLFDFNTKSLTLNKLIDIPKIAEHNERIDTLSDIINYDYTINFIKKEVLIKEYAPYKLLSSARQVNFRTKTTEHFWK